MLQALIRRDRAYLAPLLAFMTLGALALPAPAQCTIDQAISRGTAELGQGQKDAIKTFVECAIPGLSSPDPVKIAQARAMLTDPLRDAQVAAPFRIELSRQLEPVLSALAADNRDIVAINALVVAGDLATDTGLNIAEKHLTHADPAVRYAAVHAVTQSLESLARTAPALRDERLERTLGTLGKQLAAEQDPRVTDALARAIAAAIAVDAPGLQTVRPRAVSELSLRLGARLKARAGKPLDPMLLETAITCGTTVRDALANAGAQNRLPEQTITDACELGGHMLASVARLIRDKADLPQIAGGDAPEESAPKVQARQSPSQVVALAETILGVSGVDSPVLRNPPRRLSDLVKTAKAEDDARFLDGVQQLIGPEGAVIKQKGFKPDRFLP